MPRLGGIEATRQIRAREEKLQQSRKSYIIALSGGDEDELAEARDAGANQFFRKPVSIATLDAFLSGFRQQFESH